MKKHLLSLGAAALLVASLFVSSSDAKAAENQEVKIAEGIYVGTVYVGGMTEAEANAAISDYVDSLMSTEFTLNGAADKSISVTAEEMGISADASDSVEEALSVTHSGSIITRYKDTVDLKTSQRVLPLVLNVDKQQTARLLYDKQKKLSIEAKNAGLTKSGSEFTYVPGSNGEKVLEVESVYAINDFLEYQYDGTQTEIDLVTEVVNARGSEAELKEIKDNLGTFSTNFGDPSTGRGTNVKNACQFVNGSVVYPGEEFSCHDAIAPLTVENGYAVGGAYLNGQLVDSIGGGVCQVATTLYNAAIRAELEITMRYNHSMLVTYVDPSDDAAIAGDYKDLHFVNNTDTPIYIEGYCNGSNITFSIWGKETRDSSRKVNFESVILSQDDEVQKEFSYDSSAEVGVTVPQSGHIAMQAQLWKIVTVNGVQESRELFNTSTYVRAPKTIVIGTSGVSAEQLQRIKDAVATGDEDTVWATVAQIQAEMGAAAPAEGDAPAADTPATDAPTTDTTTSSAQ